MSLIHINLADHVVSESAAKFKVKDGVLYLPSEAKGAIAKATAEIKKAGELIKKGGPMMDFFDQSSNYQHGNPTRYKKEAEKRKESKSGYMAAHKQAAIHIKNAKTALKDAGLGSIRPAFGSEIITRNGKSNISYVNQFKADTFRAPGKDQRLKVKFVKPEELKSISGAFVPEEEEHFDSESAAKKPSYKIAKVNGVATLVVNSEKKAELTTILGHLKKAKTAGISAARNIDAWNKTRAKAKTQTGEAKAKTSAKAADYKAKGSAALKEAKLHLKESASYARKHGLSGLKMPLTTASIQGITEKAPKVLAALRTAKLTEFGVTGKRGAFKPKFLATAKFEALGSKTITKAAAKAKAPAKKPTQQIRPGAMKKMKPGGRERVNALLKKMKQEENSAMANAKKEIPGFRKSDLKHMNYSIGKNDSIEIMAKDGKTYQFTGDHAEKTGLSLLPDMIQDAGGRQYNISSNNPEYGVAKKSKRK